MEKRLAIIPARGGSKGVPNKNLRKIGGLTLTAHAIKCAKETGLFDAIVVSSDSHEILSDAEDHGAETVKRPKDLASDSANIVDAVLHVLKVFEEKGLHFTSVALLEPSSPLRTPKMVTEVINQLGEYDSAFSVSQVDTKFHPSKQFQLSDTGLATPVCPHLKQPVNRQTIAKSFIRNGACYGFKVESFLEHLQILCGNTKGVISNTPLVNIDTEGDMIRAQGILETQC